jgi:hypothetical protein
MARDPVTASAAGRPWVRPWPVLLTGLGLLGVGYLLSGWNEDAVVPFRVLFVLGGLILAGAAISLRLRSAGQELDERIESAAVVAVAALGALVALGATDPSWDSIQLFFGVLVGVGLTGAVLVLLPTLIRRVVLAVAVLYHFGAIFTATTMVDPPGYPAPWVSHKLWSSLYRPYQEFMYLSNAYHFYSPNPGPPTLFWYRLEYKSGKHKWVNLPTRETSPIPLHYQRLLALAESASQDAPPVNEHVLRYLSAERQRSSLIKFGIQGHPDLPTSVQFRQPQVLAQWLMRAYTRHMARTYPHWDSDPDDPIASIKLYRVTHQIIGPRELGMGYSPLYKGLYLPYYQGKFSPDGELLDGHVMDSKGRILKMGDHHLYWLLPILARIPDSALIEQAIDDPDVPAERKEHLRGALANLQAARRQLADDQGGDRMPDDPLVAAVRKAENQMGDEIDRLLEDPKVPDKLRQDLAEARWLDCLAKHAGDKNPILVVEPKPQ